MFENIMISGFADEIDANFDKQLEVVKKLGVPAIELRTADGVNVSDFTEEKAKEVKAKLDAAGIIVSSLGSPIGKIEITDDFEPHFEKFKQTIKTAKILNCKYIRMFSFFMPKDSDPAQYTDEVMARLEKLLAYAKEQDVILLHENEKDIYGDIAPRCKEILERFYCDHFKAVFDFANFVQCKQDTLEAYEMMKPYIAYVHIKDAKWEDGTVVPAGMGDGNVAKILGMLKESGYQGFLSLEPHLANFGALQNLEKNAAKRDEAWTGEMAFTTAHNALQDVLKTL